VLVSGEYSLDVLGASGGASNNGVGGLGAEVSGDISLTAGETLTLFVGGQGQNGGVDGGGGGGSYLAPSLFTDQSLTAGVNSGDGSISITPLTPAVPEPSTWAMTLAGFAGLGWLARMRRRKTSPA
jgi:hypothetical protein